MSLATLSLLLAATVATPQPVARAQVTASVQIIAAEEIRFAELEPRNPQQMPTEKLTQKRVRDAMPMIEFY